VQIALVSAATSAPSFSFARLLVIIVLLGIGFPLIRKLRTTASERRKRLWVEEGLMAPPTAEPGSNDQPE
jgi:hypothetical protein